jgi:hypothetical protein
MFWANTKKFNAQACEVMMHIRGLHLKGHQTLLRPGQ